MRSIVLCVALLLGVALGAAGCSSSGGSKATVGTPSGTVTVRSGNKVVCVITLDKSGTGTCKVSTADYAPGKVTYAGTYNGSAGFKPGSATTTLTVLPAKPAGPVASSAAPGAS